MDKILIACAALALAGCQTTGSGFCDVAEPYYFTNQAEIDQTPAPVLRHIVRNNEVGEKLCKWDAT